MGTDFFDNITGAQPKNAVNSDLDYYVRVGEEYEVAGVLTQFLNLALTSNTIINASLLYDTFTTYDISTYELQGTDRKFLTNRPNPQKRTINATRLDYVF